MLETNWARRHLQKRRMLPVQQGYRLSSGLHSGLPDIILIILYYLVGFRV